MTTSPKPPTHKPAAIRLAVMFIVIVMVAAACTSDDGVINLGKDGLSAPVDAGQVDSSALEEAVTFTFEDFDGEKLTLDDLPDGPIVLNFFASWCPPCVAEMPDFETVHQNFAGEVSFLGLASQDRVERAAELVEETGVTYQVGNDQNGRIFSMFGGLAMPTTVFIKADRTVASVHSGGLDVESLSQAINDELLS